MKHAIVALGSVSVSDAFAPVLRTKSAAACQGAPLILWVLSALSTVAVLFLEPRLTTLSPRMPASIPLHQS